MKDIHELLESLVQTYNERKPMNYSDLRDIIAQVHNKKLVHQFIEVYENKEQLNFIHLRSLENYIEYDRIENSEKNN